MNVYSTSVACSMNFYDFLKVKIDMRMILRMIHGYISNPLISISINGLN